jgi:hypothetical protein
MSEPEVFALIASLVVGIIGWGVLAVRGAAVDRRLWSTPDGRMRPGGGLGCLATVSAWFSIGAVVFYVLLNFAASDVKPDAKYVLLYLVMGYAFAAVNTIALRLYGWKVPDMFERRNRAAHTLFYTATLASVCAYAGANIGDGPGFHVVLYCAVLAHLGLYALVVVHAALNRTAYRILVDRDRGIAFRAGCMFIAIGAILGRSVAGDWTGFAAATGDFLRLGWPAVLYVVADTIAARVSLSREVDGNLWADRTTGVVYLLAAVGYIFTLGAPV